MCERHNLKHREGFCDDCILETMYGMCIRSLRSIWTGGPLNRW